MKFLNEIDGASKLKQDSSNRLVTDVQKASWNSKAEGNHNHSKNEITDFPTSLPASGGQSTTTEHLVGDDTRSVNSPPSVYMSSGSRWAGRAGWQTEFKYRSTIGSPSSLSGTYVYLQTHTPWSDPSGGYPVQIAYGNGAPSWRVGVSDSTWSDWESFNDNGNAATVNGKTVLIDVPINAKFTDTTYTEITTAEIDTGTASTLRTITGRRVKYILDKVQGWIGGLTKSDVGLSNVDNIKQATKTEFDEHLADYATFVEQVEGGNVGGLASFSGSSLETTIAHKLGAIPTSAYCFPVNNPEGYLGEVWIRMDEVNLYVGNTGSYTGEMVWTAIK